MAPDRGRLPIRSSARSGEDPMMWAEVLAVFKNVGQGFSLARGSSQTLSHGSGKDVFPLKPEILPIAPAVNDARSAPRVRPFICTKTSAGDVLQPETE